MFRFGDPFGEELAKWYLSQARYKELYLACAAYILMKLINEDYNNPDKQPLDLWDLKLLL